MGVVLIIIVLAFVIPLLPGKESTNQNKSGAGVQPTTTVQQSPIVVAPLEPSPSTTPTTAKSDTRSLCIKADEAKSEFGGRIRIGVNGLEFGGTPLHRTVNITVSSPGTASKKFINLVANDTITYKGQGKFEISVGSLDTFNACFNISQLNEKDLQK